MKGSTDAHNRTTLLSPDAPGYMLGPKLSSRSSLKEPTPRSKLLATEEDKLQPYIKKFDELDDLISEDQLEEDMNTEEKKKPTALKTH